MRERVSPNLMLWVNRISGLVIMIFGVYSLVSIFHA
jgi:hypothetical protein